MSQESSMFKQSFNNYNLFIFMLFLLLLTLIEKSKSISIIIYLLTLLLSCIFIYNQVNQYTFSDIETLDDVLVVLSNYLLTLLSVFLIYYLVRKILTQIL
jgi:hypothetical protein